jgi:K+-transporting ATPase ATPase C chain
MKPIRTAVLVTIFWTVVVGGIYPLLMYGVGAAFFPGQAQGSLLVKDGKVVGSALIGQDFSDNAFFHSRPSSITYDASNSGATNWGWTSSDLKKAYGLSRLDWQIANSNTEPPQEMVTASGSGLDPHVSPQGAELQVPRVAAARHLSSADTERLLTLVRSLEEAPQLGFLGEPRVNVLKLNIAVDGLFPAR